MTELELSELNPEKDTIEWQAKYIVEAWESRFPDALSDSGRYLLYHFIKDGFEMYTSEKD